VKVDVKVESNEVANEECGVEFGASVFPIELREDKVRPTALA
jgi:hypothetical protein